MRPDFFKETTGPGTAWSEMIAWAGNLLPALVGENAFHHVSKIRNDIEAVFPDGRGPHGVTRRPVTAWCGVVRNGLPFGRV